MGFLFVPLIICIGAGFVYAPSLFTAGRMRRDYEQCAIAILLDAACILAILALASQALQGNL